MRRQSGRGTASEIQLDIGQPSTSSMTTYSSGSTPPTSWTVSTFGCDSDASSRASRRKRARRRSADAATAISRRRLIATLRCSLLSNAV